MPCHTMLVKDHSAGIVSWYAICQHVKTKSWEPKKRRTGIQLTPAESTARDAAYSRFVAGKIDILYGANDTPERE